MAKDFVQFRNAKGETVRINVSYVMHESETIMNERVVYYTVYGYNTPSGEKTFSKEIDALKDAHRLAQDSWVSQVVVVRKEVIWTHVKD